MFTENSFLYQCSFFLITGHNELMRLLIYSGFNPRQKDNYGQTSLHLACINGNLTAVKELCEQVGNIIVNFLMKHNKYACFNFLRNTFRL